MKALKHLAEWIWKQLEKLHLLYWLLELLGWQKIVFSTFVAIALALEAKSEHLPLTYIILIGLFSFALVMVLVETGLRLYKRMRPTQPRIPAHPPSTGANHRPEIPIPCGDEEIFLEGELSLDTMTWKARVPFRQPFLRTPEVTLLCRADGRATDEPSIDKVTVDYFEVSTNDSRVTGKWLWRAKGSLVRDESDYGIGDWEQGGAGKGEHQRAISKRGEKYYGGEGSRVPIPGPERREHPIIKHIMRDKKAGAGVLFWNATSSRRSANQFGGADAP